ncbi:hypothetical protein PMI14_00733 [Acidovorax sp. CF316]|uniref:DUF1801 domain-containing protein n=1 Tax=Acidovorax sp. CF316 TaxID=1144317 RepID=UPI00026BC261|nr:DUF1801 domain-containing protein [Acidovorax sp. CF316]EJE54365.1 hypothetical protein PMI14_00733 [Acidovorax sp. CF316]
MKMVLTSATTPEGYIGCLEGWQRSYCEALRTHALAASPALQERLKWGHLVFFSNGPVLLVRAEPRRVLLGFWRGQRLQHLEPRLKAGGQYEMATLVLLDDTPLDQAVFVRLVRDATALNAALGDPTA